MNFGQALEALKEDKRVARCGWNGKDMWLTLVGKTYVGVSVNEELGRTIEQQPYIAIKTVQDTLVPWLASQTDMLAEDWQIV